MKKALIVLLILAVAGGAFAQTWSGQVRTGALFTFADDMPVAAFDDDGDHAVYGELNFTSEGDDWGATIGSNVVVGMDNTVSGFNIGDFNGWVKFADIFKLTAGKGVGGDWQATTEIFDEGPGGSNAGARLQVEPIAGLNFGVVFGYPNGGVSAEKIGSFFQETGIGVKYTSDLFTVGTALKLFSEETDDYPKTDANWWFDALIPLAGLFDIHVDGYVKNLLGDLDKEIAFGIKLMGTVIDHLSWWVKGVAYPSDDPFSADIGAGLSYSYPINDKATAEAGGEVGLSKKDEFNFDSWNIYAKLGYDFNANVSTSFKFKVAGDMTGDETKLTPTLLWLIKYTF